MVDVSDKIVEKIKAHILYSITFFDKSYRLWDNVEKRSKQGRHDKMADASGMLDN
jgi:hypothetical protein